MAPELLSDRSRAPDPRTEMFSFGLILYETLAGQHAFGAGTPDQLVAGILHENSKPLSQEMPAPLADIIGRCLEKDPDRRFESMHEITLALDGFMAARKQTHYPTQQVLPWQPEGLGTPEHRTFSGDRGRSNAAIRRIG